MASFTLDLVGAPLNMASEGGLDTSIYGGVSLQRTGYIETVDSSGNRKMNVRIDDGATFTDVKQALTDLTNAGHNFIV